MNILPFIDVQLLKKTIASECPDTLLSPDERARNSRGKVFCYTYDAAMNETVPSCNRDIGLSDITKCNSRVDTIDEYYGTDVSFKPELVPGTQIPYPGYPSLNVLPIENAELIPIGLNCFGMQSKYPNTAPMFALGKDYLAIGRKALLQSHGAAFNKARIRCWCLPKSHLKGDIGFGFTPNLLAGAI